MSYIKKKSKKQEERTAKQFNGRATLASGALWIAKGDVRSDEYLIENKFTDNSFYSLSKATWDKINREAIKDDFRTPLMQIDIQEEQYVILEYPLYQELSIEWNFKPKFISMNRSVRIQKGCIKSDEVLVIRDMDDKPILAVVHIKEFFALTK